MCTLCSLGPPVCNYQQAFPVRRAEQCQADWESDWERAPWVMNFPKFPVRHHNTTNKTPCNTTPGQLVRVAMATRQSRAGGLNLAGQSVSLNMYTAGFMWTAHTSSCDESWGCICIRWWEYDDGYRTNQQQSRCVLTQKLWRKPEVWGHKRPLYLRIRQEYTQSCVRHHWWKAEAGEEVFRYFN